MSLVALVTIIGFGTGFAVALVTGSTASAIFSRLRVLQVNHWPVLALGAVLSLAVGLDTNKHAGRYALGISLALLLAGCLLNRHITGASVAAIGFAANLGVLLLNGYVPVNECPTARGCRCEVRLRAAAPVFGITDGLDAGGGLRIRTDGGGIRVVTESDAVRILHTGHRRGRPARTASE